jgi:hypothetical protein
MAKPLTRLVRYLFNSMGYDFLRLQKIHMHDEAKSGLGRGGGFDAYEPVAPRPVKQFDIFFRSCARVDVLFQERTRFIGAPKSEVVLRCLNSLIRAIDYAQQNGIDCPIGLTVQDDNSDADCVAAMRRLLDAAPCRTEFRNLDGTGVNASLRETYARARETAKDLLYITADDYLHDERAVLEMVRTYERLAGHLKKDIVLFPMDGPEFYRNIYPTHLVLGSHRHWRSIPVTTSADVMTLATLKRHWDVYMAFSDYGKDGVTEANTLAAIYGDEVPCFSPVPSLAVHFQHFDTLSPYFDWQKWWDASALAETEDARADASARETVPGDAAVSP